MSRPALPIGVALGIVVIGSVVAAPWFGLTLPPGFGDRRVFEGEPRRR